MTHTHKGTCQLCGRIQAVNNKTGEIAKHGYTVDYGFFSGTCRGSGYLPLQQDRAELDSQIKSWEEFTANQLALTVADIKSVPVLKRLMTAEEFVLVPKHQRYFATFAEAAEYYLHNIHARAQGLINHVADMKKMADKVFGADLYSVQEEVKEVREFQSYADAYAFFLELKNKGIKPSIRRLSPYSNVQRVFWKEVA